MFYKLKCDTLPDIDEVYSNVRKTVWRCADKRNILIFVKSGSCIFELSGKEYVVKEGQFVIIAAGEPYVRKPIDDKECEFFYVHFRTREPIAEITASELEKELSATVDSVLSFSPDNTRSSIYLSQITALQGGAALTEAMLKEFNKGRHYNRLIIAIKLMELLALLGRELLADKSGALLKSGRFPVALERGIIYINRSYKQKITVEELSLYCGVSHQHLIRLFRKHLGASPVQYINKNKVFHAIDLLRSTNMTVSEIAYELGFDDPNYFSRIFKKEEGCSPLEARRRILSYKG